MGRQIISEARTMNDELSILYQSPNGDTFDFTGLTTSFSISASLKAEATKAQFIFVRDDDLQIEMGGVVHVTAGETTIFYGFVFTVRMSQDVAVQVDAYDALRYLKNEVFYPWPKQTLSERFKAICENISLDVGTVDDSSYQLKPVLSEGKTLFSVLQEAIDDELQNEAKLFYVRANQRTLELINVENDVVDLCIDSDSYINGYSYEQTIDKSTYNQVHFWHEGDDKNLRLIAEVHDDEKTKQWGRLRLSRKIDSNETEAQLKDRAEKTLVVHGQPTEALSLTCFGDWRVHAGCIITVSLPELGETYENRNFIVSNCTHNYQSDNHTMSLQLLFTGGGL